MANALVWLRRDLRLHDNPSLAQAVADGYDPIPIYVHAPEEESPWSPGAASSAWLHYSLVSLSSDIQRLGGQLILAKGDSFQQLNRLMQASKSKALYFSNCYEPKVLARDANIETAFKNHGVNVRRSNSSLLFEPWQIQTGSGTPYRVFTPFWRNASAQLMLRDVYPQIDRLKAISKADSISVEELQLLPKHNWHDSFWQHWQPGESGALEMLDVFCDGALLGYKEQRNLPDRTGTSKLSPHLHFGEISPHQIWRRIESLKLDESTQADITHFKSELGWREFSNHLLYHFPQSCNSNLNPQFDHFDWAEPESESLSRWQHGMTGIPIVDAGMRELWQTGWMHNRVRMIVASYLCKNMRYHWLHGARWFWDTLVDANLANNSQGWQWTAGTGCDAAPYFRIFNPVTQSERFDPQARYIKRWLPEVQNLPVPLVFAPWQKPEQSRLLAPDYPSNPIVDLVESRRLALEAYSSR